MALQSSTQYLSRDSAGVKLAYRLLPSSAASGVQRAPIVLCIGWTGVKEDWASLPSTLASWGHAVLAFDNRGMGESTVAEGGSGAAAKWGMEEMAADTLALIDAVFPQQRVHLMGISMGGMLAQAVSASRPDKFLSVILGCTTISVRKPIGVVMPNALAMPTEVPRTAAERRTLVQGLLAHNYTPSWVASNRDRFEALVDESLKYSRPMEGTLLQSRALSRFDGLATVDRIASIPALVISGTADQVIAVQQSRELAKRLPLSTLVLLPEVGHLFWIQDEAGANEAIKAFLERVESGKGGEASDDDKRAKL